MENKTTKEKGKKMGTRSNIQFDPKGYREVSISNWEEEARSLKETGALK